MAATYAEVELDHFWMGTGHYDGLSMNTDEDNREALRRFLGRNIVIPRTETDNGEVTEAAEYIGVVVKAGSGPESVRVFPHSNPNWLRNQAINLLNVADYLENRDAILAAKEAEVKAAREKRRQELAKAYLLTDYWNLKDDAQKFVDRFIDMEDAAK